MESALRGAPLNKTMITVSIMLATIIQAIDGTIANVALPHMQGSFNATLEQVNWVLTSFIVATAVTTPLTGWLCDRWGLKHVFLVSIGGFTLASMLCGLANSLPEIVLARILQGVFGAALVPLSQAVLLNINTKEEHGSAMAIWGVGVMIGPMLGPMLGGWLTDNYSWRWVFLINLPIGALAFAGIYRYIESVPGERKIAFDLKGFVSLSFAVASLQLMLDRGQENDWFESWETWSEFITLTVSLSYFVVHTIKAPHGHSFFEYRLLKNMNYIMGLMFIFIVGLVLFATRSLTPSMLQGLLNYSALQAGWVLAPSGLGTMIAMLVVGKLVGKFDVRYILVIGFALTAYSLFQMSSYSLEIAEKEIIWPGFLQGVGLGLIFVPLSTATFATLTPELRAEGTAIYSLVRNLGSSVGIALVQTLLIRNAQTMHASLVENIGVDKSNPASSTLANGLDLSSLQGLGLVSQEIERQATMVGYVDDFWMMFILTLVIIPLVVLIKPVARIKHRP